MSSVISSEFPVYTKMSFAWFTSRITHRAQELRCPGSVHESPSGCPPRCERVHLSGLACIEAGELSREYQESIGKIPNGDKRL